MKTMIIHLSDAHLKSKNNVALSRKTKILEAVQNLAPTSDIVFIVFTGDVAYSGLESEYHQAAELIDYLKKEIESHSKRFVSVL